MKIKTNIIIVLLTLCLFSTNFSYSQIKAVNDKGEKIIVYPDGRWEYDTEGQAPAPTATPNPPIETKPKQPKSKPQEKVYSNAEMIAARGELLNQYKALKAEIQSHQNEGQQRHQELSVYMNENASKNMSPAELKAYNARVRILQRQIKTATKNAKSLMKKEQELQKVLTSEGPKMMVYYEKIKAAEAKVLAAEQRAKEREKQKALANAKAEYEKQLQKIQEEKTKAFEEKMKTARLRSSHLLKYKQNQKFKAPKPICELAFDEVDAFTGKRKRATTARPLFSFSDDAYEHILKGKGYIECEGFLSEINDGKEMLLVLDFKVENKDAFVEFGGVEKGKKIIFKLLNGKTVTLTNKQTDKGKVHRNTTVFRGFYNVSKGNMDLLKNSEVFALRMFWGNGFEDYEVYQMDFFIEQVSCLRELK